MNFDEYQRKAHSTAQYPTDIFYHSAEGQKPVSYYYSTIGLAGEVGELLNQIKKIVRDDNGDLLEPRIVEIRDEIGDCIWYIADLCTRFNWSMNEIAENNIAKLALRLKNNQIHGDKR